MSVPEPPVRDRSGPIPRMPLFHFSNLLIVVAVGSLAPLALGFYPRVRLPAIVLEILLGIAIGPSGLGWVKPDLVVSVLAALVAAGALPVVISPTLRLLLLRRPSPRPRPVKNRRAGVARGHRR